MCSTSGHPCATTSDQSEFSSLLLCKMFPASLSSFTVSCGWILQTGLVSLSTQQLERSCGRPRALGRLPSSCLQLCVQVSFSTLVSCSLDLSESSTREYAPPSWEVVSMMLQTRK